MATEEEKLASNENEKLDIEDIEAPEEEGAQEEIDLEEAVSDEPEEPAKESVETKTEVVKKEKKKRKLFSRKTKEKKEKTEKVATKQASEPEEAKPEVTKKKKSGLKTFLTVVLTMLLTTALVLGGVYFWLSREKTVSPTETAPVVKEEIKTEAPKTESKSVYVNSEVGLNLRQEPLKTAPVLVIIPFGTKLSILEESGEWFKTTYDSKTGWVMKEYTTTENPLVYTNSTYGFTMTFPSAWAGYKLFPVKELWEGVTASYYVGIPTTNANYTESGIDKGYVSLFAISVYTKAQWTAVQAEEGIKPTMATQNTNYVIAYSLPNGTRPEDVEARAAEVKQIIATLKFN